MAKVLWVGDAACDSGFARATHQTLDVVRETHEVAVIGLNYRGDPHDYPYKIYPALQPGGDLMGASRLKDLIRKEKADLVVIQNDPWNIPRYMRQVEDLQGEERPYFVGAIAVDGKNADGLALNTLDHVVFWTEFAREEAYRGGLWRPSSVVPLGVDLAVYHPDDRLRAREYLLGDFFRTRIPEHAFIVLNVNRNQPRKRLDLTVEYFAEWMHSRDIRDAWLYLHVCPTGDFGINVDKLCGYYGLQGHSILAQPGVYQGVPEADLAMTYQASDVTVNTGHGEGWGLPALEGFACGIPHVCGDWAAMGDWAKDAALLVPIAEHSCGFGGPNVIGGVIDKRAFIQALDDLYRNRELRYDYGRKGLLLAQQPRYRWRNIGLAFRDVLDGVLERCHSAPA